MYENMTFRHSTTLGGKDNYVYGAKDLTTKNKIQFKLHSFYHTHVSQVM